MKKIVEVKNVCMKFNMMDERVDSLKEYVIKLFKGKLFYNEFVGLNNISFDLYQTDILGIVGLNGAGKSTLLKIMSGILKPSSGQIRVYGSVSPLIEVGAGFDPELTARENIYLNGAILGYSKNFLTSKFDEIIHFAELENFINVPLKNFSSGMYARLGFSIATISKPDLLIVDEVLSVGDFHFQAKCEERIHNMIREGTTVAIVSHDIDIIKKLCNKVLWLSHGNMKMMGKTDEVVKLYEQC